MEERVMEGSGEKGQVLQELWAIGLADARDYYRIEDGTLRIRDPGELSPVQSAAVASFEQTANGIRVKFYDKLRALELLGKHMGLFEGGGSAQENAGLLQALLDSTREEMNLSDIPEIQQATDSGHDMVEPGKPSGS